jgi:hypothetical protein
VAGESGVAGAGGAIGVVTAGAAEVCPVLLSCQPSMHFGGNAQTPRFSERRASLVSERHFAGFRNDLSRSVIPNAAIRLLL